MMKHCQTKYTYLLLLADTKTFPIEQKKNQHVKQVLTQNSYSLSVRIFKVVSKRKNESLKVTLLI